MNEKIVEVERVSKQLYIYVFIPIGMIGNIVSAIIYLRSVFRSTAMGIYLTAVSIQSGIVLITNWQVVFISFDFPKSTFYCKFISLLDTSLFHSITFLIMAVSIDRYLLVFYPHRFGIIKKLKFQVSVVTVIFIVSVLLNISTAINIEYLIIEGEHSCVWTDPTNSSDFTYIVPYLVKDNILMFFIPLTLNTIITIAIIRKLRSMNEKINKTAKRHNNKRYTISSIISIVFFILCHFPMFISDIISIIIIYKLTIVGYMPQVEVQNIVSKISHLIRSAHYAFSIFPHIIFNILFRQELLDLIKKCF